MTRFVVGVAAGSLVGTLVGRLLGEWVLWLDRRFWESDQSADSEGVLQASEGL